MKQTRSPIPMAEQNTRLIATHGSIEDFDRYVRDQIRDVRKLVASIGLRPE